MCRSVSICITTNRTRRIVSPKNLEARESRYTGLEPGGAIKKGPEAANRQCVCSYRLWARMEDRPRCKRCTLSCLISLLVCGDPASDEHRRRCTLPDNGQHRIVTRCCDTVALRTSSQQRVRMHTHGLFSIDRTWQRQTARELGLLGYCWALAKGFFLVIPASHIFYVSDEHVRSHPHPTTKLHTHSTSHMCTGPVSIRSLSTEAAYYSIPYHMYACTDRAWQRRAHRTSTASGGWPSERYVSSREVH